MAAQDRVRRGPASAAPRTRQPTARGGGRRAQAVAAQCAGRPPDEGGEDRWVSPAQVWSWQLMIAAFLAVMFAQVGFLGHDAPASAGVPFLGAHKPGGGA